MVKAVKYTPIAQEIKKEYLKEHLENVKQLINNWIKELNVPDPLSPNKGTWGWQSVYRPSTEIDPDSNHMLRRHLRSRTLWSHHANWWGKLYIIWDLISQVREAAGKIHSGKSPSNLRCYAEDYLNTALWQSFELTCNRKLKIDYKIPENQRGLSFGAYVIETSAATENDRNLVEKEHQDLKDQIAQTTEIKNLTSIWIDIVKLQESMQAIALEKLKSSDILYPCRFCKHLWK